MKRALLFVFLAFWVPAAWGRAPVIFFSDLTSGPATGGQNDHGVFVTIRGSGFGASRGTGFVSVGKGRVEHYPVWEDSRITFQLGPQAHSGEITVTTDGGTSNGIAFTVRPGSIYFVSASSPRDPGSGTFEDPWRSPASFFKAMKPGDTCYFRQGTYPGRYGSESRAYNISFYNTEAPSGSAGNEIAWVGYPGEAPLFKADDDTVNNGAVELVSDKEYYIFAGLSIYSRGDGRGAVRIFTDHNRLINCRIEGIKTKSYGMIELSARQGTRIWGNECFGAASGNKLDHVLYCQGGASDVDFGWNYIHDNDIAEGPIISINNDNADVENITYENVRIHDNLIDCRRTPTPARAIGIVSTDTGSSVYIYNNVIIGAGSPHAIYQYSAASHIYNNTIYQAKGKAAIYLTATQDGANNYRPESADIRNNILVCEPGCAYIDIDRGRPMGEVTIGNNCYSGNGRGPLEDARAVNRDPRLRDPENLDFRLSADSPCVKAGSNVFPVVTADRGGRAYGRGSAFSIGAYAFP